MFLYKDINKTLTHNYRTEEDDEMDFDAELAMMEDIEMGDSGSVSGAGPEKEESIAKWARPPISPLDPKNDTITFQQIDLDHYLGWCLSV